MQLLTANLTNKVRSETLNGREYLVAPLSMIVPGVLNGSKGALYYPLDEISRTADAWNGMPIVVNHPSKDGRACSARSPEILQKFGVGTVFNVDMSEGKLSAEGWFDVLKIGELSPSTLTKLSNNEPEELSTGLFTDNEPIEGQTHNGKPYQAIARNYRPDHLAILPGKKGACSIEDGCGVNVNEETTNSGGTENASGQGGSDNDCDDGNWGNASATGQSLNEEDLDRHIDWDSVDNRASFNDVKSSVWTSLRERFGMEISIQDIFPDEVVFHRDDKLVKLAFSIDEETYEVTLADSSPEEVRRVTDYKVIENCGECGPSCECNGCAEKYWYKSIAHHEAESTENNVKPDKTTGMSPEKACKILDDGEVNGKPLTKDQRGLFGSICSTKKTENVMPLSKEQKEKIVADLISNEGVEGTGPWSEGDQEALSSLPEDKLVAMNAQREMLAGLKDKETDKDDKKSEPAQNKETPVVNQQPKPKTSEEWLAEAPPEIRSAVNNAMAFERQQKDTLIGRITKNERNSFSKAYLESRSIEELQGLSALACNQEEVQQASVLTPHFQGVPGFTQNLGEDFATEDQDMIPEPFEWSKG